MSFAAPSGLCSGREPRNVLTPQPMPEPDSAMLVVEAISREEVPAACERLRALIGACDADVVVCDVGALAADLVTVEALLRMRLTARRLGRGLRLRNASVDLERIVAFCGLWGVLSGEPASGAGRCLGQPEEGEHPRGVEEGVDRGDAAV
jgi:hypothetical protein